MKDETSIFGARPERLERLVFEALQDFESEEDASPTASLGAILEKPGGYIDRYKLINILGEGGMGIVYLAEQEHPIKRRLALKVIKPGMDSKRVIARFEVERQALALLDHPNIAHVFDAGTTESGRPYFVMQFVEGLPITEHCDHHKLTVDERLKLFLQVCHAVNHAHQKGIIHRDIKPSNILVTTNEDQAVSKIIDFGVAKAVIQPLTERTLYTEHGQLFGTPEYMSPEQADMASEDIDIRSDIYSLGVLLYELLTGVLPFNPDTLRTGGIENIRKVIRETNPRTPSKQLTSLGEEARKVVERRQTEVYTLARCLHKELEWIPLKAMRKERSERYRSAAELADDIENYLKGDPLIAGPPSTLYRARKFMRRHKALVTGVAAVLAVLLAGVFISTIFAIKADRARDKEIVARAQAQQRAEQYRRSLYLRSVILADRYYYDNDIRGMRDLLKACPEDLRQWEWYHLWRVSDQSIMTLRGHTREVRSVAFSPDGKRIVSGSRDTTIKVWDAGSDRVLMTLEGHEETVNSVAFSPDGRWIVSGSDDMTVKVWDAESGRMQINLVGHEGTVSSVVFSPDGRYVASGSADATIRIWDAVTGELIRPPLQPMRIGVASVAFSPDGGRIVSCSPNTIQVWDTESGSEPMTQMKLKGFVWSVAFHPDGHRIVSGGEDGKIRVWDAESGSKLLEIDGHENRVRSVAFSPDGTRIVSGSWDGTIKVWDTESGSELVTLRGLSGLVGSVAFNPDGRRIVSGADWGENAIKLWNAQGSSEPMTLEGHTAGVTSVAFSPNGRRIASGSQDRTIRIWDVETGSVLMTHEGIVLVTSVAFSPDGRRVISGSGRVIGVWDAGTGRELIPPLSGHEGQVTSIAFSPDGTRIVSGSRDRTVRIWDAVTGELVHLPLRHTGEVTSVAFSPDGRLIVAGSPNGVIMVWDVEKGDDPIRTYTEPASATTSVGFSCDGARIIAGVGSAIKVWDTENGNEQQHIDIPIGWIKVAFSPDGSRIISGSLNWAPMLWDAESGDKLIALRGHRFRINSVAFSPDGRQIASGGGDGTIKIWGRATREEVEAEILAEEEGRSWIRKD